MAFAGMKGNMPIMNGIYANEVVRLILKLSVYSTRKIVRCAVVGLFWSANDGVRRIRVLGFLN